MKFYPLFYMNRELNKKLGSTQFRVPKTETLREAYDVSN